MTRGITFKQMLAAMKNRGVRWPISRAMAVRYHGVPKKFLPELERRGWVRPGRTPTRHLPPPTNDRRLDQIVRELTELGVRWPASRQDVRGFDGVRGKTLQALVRHGLVRGRELEELSQGLVWVLEDLEIESKEEFRARIGTGDMDLKKCRNMGPKNIERLMAWAFGNEAPPPKAGLSVRISQQAKDGLEILRVRRGLETNDELVEELVREALGPNWASR